MLQVKFWLATHIQASWTSAAPFRVSVHDLSGKNALLSSPSFTLRPSWTLGFRPSVCDWIFQDHKSQDLKGLEWTLNGPSSPNHSAFLCEAVEMASLLWSTL